jgi:hypothetical protein
LRSTAEDNPLNDTNRKPIDTNIKERRATSESEAVVAREKERASLKLALM